MDHIALPPYHSFASVPPSTRIWAEDFLPRKECVRKSSGVPCGADAVLILPLTFLGWALNNPIVKEKSQQKDNGRELFVPTAQTCLKE